MATNTDYVVTATFLVTTPDDKEMTPDERSSYVLNEFYNHMSYTPSPIHLIQVIEVNND